MSNLQPPIQTQACNCIGPQNGEPLCPCQMKGVFIRFGRYIKETDLGPAPSQPNTEPPTIFVPTVWTNDDIEQKCMWGGMDKTKPASLSCPCPRCSAR